MRFFWMTADESLNVVVSLSTVACIASALAVIDLNAASLASSSALTRAQPVVAADWTSDSEVFAVVRHHEGRFRLEYPIGTPLGDTEAVNTYVVRINVTE